MMSSTRKSSPPSITMFHLRSWCRRLESNQPSHERRVYSPPEVPASASARWWSHRVSRPTDTVCKTGPQPSGWPQVSCQGTACQLNDS